MNSKNKIKLQDLPKPTFTKQNAIYNGMLKPLGELSSFERNIIGEQKIKSLYSQ